MSIAEQLIKFLCASSPLEPPKTGTRFQFFQVKNCLGGFRWWINVIWFKWRCNVQKDATRVQNTRLQAFKLHRYHSTALPWKMPEKIYIIKNIKIIEVIPLVFHRSSFYCSVVENVGLIDILNASIRRLLIFNMGWDKYLNKQDYKIFKETPWLFHRSSFYCSVVENVGLRYTLFFFL